MASITIFPGVGFKKEAFEGFSAASQGKMEFSIIYGHPDDDFSRRFTKTLNLILFKRKDEQGKTVVLLNWTIESESDVSL
jgi:hypothetical protein